MSNILNEEINELLDNINEIETLLKSFKFKVLEFKTGSYKNKNPELNKQIAYDPDDYLGPEGLCVICISRDCPNCPHQKKSFENF